MQKIGIIGTGFVGTAIYEGMKSTFEVITYDKKYKNTLNFGLNKPLLSTPTPLSKLLEIVDGPIFVCVPTPMSKNRSADLSIIKTVFSELAEIPSAKDAIFIIKSTVPPGTTDSLIEKTKLKIVFNPEFLTEASSIEDFINQDRIIIGGNKNYSDVVKNMYRQVFTKIPIIQTNTTTAEMVKYVTNTFLSTKVAYANEIFQICKKLNNVDYDEVIEYSTKDQRLGTSHWLVPGPDGHFGFGGSCFCKDLNALIAKAEEIGCDPSLLKSVWLKNLEVRPERDWENLKGRAVTDEDLED